MNSGRFVETQNLLRDGLRRSYEARSDSEAVPLLRDAGRRTLSFLQDLLDDDALWARLASGGYQALTSEDLEQLARFADGGLQVMLSQLGYREPPPVSQLVDETVAAVALAIPDHDFGFDIDTQLASARTASARADLSLFAIRLRRLVGMPEAALPVSLARRVLRQAAEEAEDVMVAVSPILVESGLAELFPDAGLAIKLGGAVGGVIAARLAALRLRRVPELAVDGRASVERARRELGRLYDITNRGFEFDDDKAVRQAWKADSALHRVLAARPHEEGAAEALDALRALRDTAAGDTEHLEPEDDGQFVSRSSSAISRLAGRACDAFRARTVGDAEQSTATSGGHTGYASTTRGRAAEDDEQEGSLGSQA